MDLSASGKPEVFRFRGWIETSVQSRKEAGEKTDKDLIDWIDPDVYRAERRVNRSKA